MIRKVLWFVLLFAVLLGTAAGWAWQHYRQFLITPLALPDDGYVYQLAPGNSGRDIVAELVALGFTRPGWPWRLLMRLEPHVYRAGEYRLPPGATPPELLRRLASGEVIQYRLTVVEGWNFRQLAAELDSNPMLEHSHVLSDESQLPALFEQLGIEHPEGWFLPETYQFVRGDSDLDLLSRAHTAMRAALDEAWASRATDLPLKSSYELLTLASIVEKETARDSERAAIAGVLTRRLRLGMRLQTDPTVIYGLGESFDGDIRRRDLQTDTPYNTYTRHGLPPTPIAMPSRASLQAAAHPAPGDALYFVADGKGGHTFSATLGEHQAAVDRLTGKQ